MVRTCGTHGGRKTTNRGFTWTRGGEKRQRETEEDLNGQRQGRPEAETYRLDQDWRGDQKQRGLEKSFKSLIIGSLMEDQKEEEHNFMMLNDINR